MKNLDPAWAHWFVGLCDGEASFTYRNTTRADMPARPRFKLTMQDDDSLIAEINEKVFGGGYVRLNERITSRRPNGKQYQNRSDLDITDQKRLSMLVTFFDAYPLRSHKRAEFLIWRQLVDHYCFPRIPAVPEVIRQLAQDLIRGRDSGMHKRGRERLLWLENQQAAAPTT